MNKIYFNILFFVGIVAILSSILSNVIDRRDEFLQFKKDVLNEFETVEYRLEELEHASIKNHRHNKKGDVK